MTLKTKIITGLAALVMGLTPACGGDEGDTWPECSIKENVQPEDFTGTYLVLDPTCTSRYEQVSFKSEPCDGYAQFDIGGVDKKTGDLECFGLSGNCDEILNGNYYGLIDYSFIKCDENVVLMNWYNGNCSAYLEKISDEPLPGTGDDCPQ